MGVTKGFPNVPIIGADAELQAQMRADLERNRNRSAPSVRRRTAVSENARKNTRYQISNSVVCFPILASHEIDVSCSMVGIALDIGVSGIKVLIDSAQPHKGLEMLIGIEQQNGEYQFCSGVVISSRKFGASGFEAGIQFRGYIHEVLQSDQIFPVLDRADMKFVLPYPEPVLASLCKVGAALSMPLDSVTLCPNCHGIPTFRQGCSLCLSSNVRASRMIHHFACAHVDFVENFEEEDGLCCQKCRTRRLIVGSDYEYLDGPNMCYDCGQASLEKIQIGHCLSCEFRFPAESAYIMEIVGYRVNKLDLLGFINTA